MITDLKELVAANRSYRRFEESCRISFDLLRSWIDLARLTGSAGNLQQLKFVPIYDPELCVAVFSTLAWAGYLTDWSGPVSGEQPSGYIIILRDKLLSGGSFFQVDVGLTAQSMLLGAVEAGFGGCMIASFKQPELIKILGLNKEQYNIELVLALGKPKETVVVDPISEGNVRYWRDEAKTHHVPKRTLNELIVLPSKNQ